MEKGNIYCVDDDKDILTLYQVVLGAEGHEVLKLSSGADALEAIYRRDPDLIILDEKLDDYSGLEICARIRNDRSLPYIPIIMVTGVDSKEGKIRSLEEGIDDYILKPFDHEELLAKVQVMLRIKRLYTDLLQTRRELLKVERLAAVGQLAAAMAHEIRNPLSIIGASVQFLKNKLREEDEGWQIMETILRKISEIDGTIRELLAVARPLALKRNSVDLNACMQEVVGFIKEKCLSQRVELRQSLTRGLPDALGDEEHLQRVFLNIVINALNGMPKGGTLSLSTGEDQDHGLVQVRIGDTGEGIDQRDIEHLFEPFFSKRAGGSGLGLYMVKMIIDELDGTIEVNSRLGEGTEFIVGLPAINREKNLKAMEAFPDTTPANERGGD